jgi:hypothetical protein
MCTLRLSKYVKENQTKGVRNTENKQIKNEPCTVGLQLEVLVKTQGF